jgi:hypothetical protein
MHKCGKAASAGTDDSNRSRFIPKPPICLSATPPRQQPQHRQTARLTNHNTAGKHSNTTQQKPDKPQHQAGSNTQLRIGHNTQQQIMLTV